MMMTPFAIKNTPKSQAESSQAKLIWAKRTHHSLLLLWSVNMNEIRIIFVDENNMLGFIGA